MKSKDIRSKGKLSLSKYFQELKKGDSVAIIRDLGFPASFPKSLQGKTGVISEKQGSVYVISVKDQKKEKKFLISPIHLKKITQTKNDKKQ